MEGNRVLMEQGENSVKVQRTKMKVNVLGSSDVHQSSRKKILHWV